MIWQFDAGQAYFPIVFSQYNPNVTKRFSHQRDDSFTPVLHKDTGFWRDFGFGMVCTYRYETSHYIYIIILWSLIVFQILK